MRDINVKRVIGGGLLAGLVINVSETILNVGVLGDQMAAAMERLNIAMAPWAMPYFLTMAFLFGIGIVGLYAAVRPRFGAGPRTAIGVGAAFWIFATLLPGLANVAMGMSAGFEGATALTFAWTLVEAMVAALVGGWVYQEGASSAAPGRTGVAAGS